MIEHIALAHRNSGSGWVIMSTDGRQWEAERVDATLPLGSMMNEALALLARHPESDFTFSTRVAHELWRAPFQQQGDLANVEREINRATIVALVADADLSWSVLSRPAHGTFHFVKTALATDTYEILRHWADDAQMIERGITGPFEIWLRRQWNAVAVVGKPSRTSVVGNVTPLRRRPMSPRLQALSDWGSHG